MTPTIRTEKKMLTAVIKKESASTPPATLEA
jgi:hypothetical protein